MQRVLITGANRGIGLAFTQQCLQRGDTVFAGARAPERSEELIELRAAYPGRLHVVPLAVDDAASLEAAWRLVRERTEALDLLVNNAGINAASAGAGGKAAHCDLGQLDGERMLHMFRVNAVAPLLVAQRFLDLLQAGSRPVIASVSSTQGSITKRTTGGLYTYPASKAALNMLMRVLAWDVQPLGIISIVLMPGWVRTDMGTRRAPIGPVESVAGMLKAIDGVTMAETGSFLCWDGGEEAW